jgi:protein-L-isoaspartate(D-aspartate) O-methyltransferase
MTDDLEAQRRSFAENLRGSCRVVTDALVEALAVVRREQFLPPGPWTIRGEGLGASARLTADADPRHVVQNVSVAIDPERHLFNGAPSAVVNWIDRLALRPGARVLHVGCGLGYYSALIAHCLGPGGRTVAIEIDTGLAARARANLASFDRVEVRQGDGTAIAGESFDAILIHAGVTHPAPMWLDALAPDGRMILPLTCSIPIMGPLGKGVVVELVRTADAFPAASVAFTMICSAIGIRDRDLNERIGLALSRNPSPSLKRMRRDPHEESLHCWLHGAHFCFSLR